MTDLWNLALFHPLLNVLLWLYQLTSSLGWSIIAITIALRAALTPLIIPSLKVSKKMQELAPELAKLKTLHKENKQALMTAQAELYKQHGINPASGCLPQVVQILVLIALFNAFNLLLNTPANQLVGILNPRLYAFNQLSASFTFSTKFFAWDLVKPDVYKVAGFPVAIPGVLLVLSAIVQFISSKMMLPVVSEAERAARKTSEETDDVMAATQEQMLYMFPVMTIIFGYQFPAGLVLYWLVFSVASVVQQYFISGWGGLTPWLNRLKLAK